MWCLQLGCGVLCAALSGQSSASPAKCCSQGTGRPHQVRAVFCGTVRAHGGWRCLKDSSGGFGCYDVNSFSEQGSSFELGREFVSFLGSSSCPVPVRHLQPEGSEHQQGTLVAWGPDMKD